jgi:amidohydrolase
MQIPHLINLHHCEMTAWRHDLHAHPELGFEEHRTSAFVAGKLAEFGCEVHRNIGKTGVVGVLIHLSACRRRDFAKAMIRDGLFERFPCDSVFGMHNRPGLPIGKFAIRPGPMMAGGAYFDITVIGKGSHGARPEEGIGPVLTACHVTTVLQAIVSRNISPSETAVVSVTTIQAADAYNVIPQTAAIRGTFRTFSSDTMKLIEDGMQRTATGVAAAFGATAKVDFPAVFAPLVNNPDETKFIADVAADLVGEAHVDRNRSPTMGSEDFARMLEACPGAYIAIGNAGAVGSCPVHNPNYDFNDKVSLSTIAA